MTIPHMNHAISKNSKNKVSNTLSSTQGQNAVRKQLDEVVDNEEPLPKKLKMPQAGFSMEPIKADNKEYTQAAVGQVASMELKPASDMDPTAVSAASAASMSNEVLKPETPQGPIIIGKNVERHFLWTVLY